ncbi:uncharacterized protein LOC114744408 [Neltuma alba]|uniref:uncharacterized protein LOC114744408 n=1 Tax=Neltuma alba TaxID=207710 RepID=UPI0010A41B0B|nr:uncharacterized protein LOC114744408 [Prosopis alba]
MDSLENEACLFIGEDKEEECSGISELNHSLENFKRENFSDELQNHHQERTLYWESQEAMLQEIVERYKRVGWELREEVGEILEEAKKVPQYGYGCKCRKPNSTTSYGCSHCLRTLVVSLLSLRGYNASLRLSKWDSTKSVPGGSHQYIEVMPNTQTRKKQMPYLIELELRDQFQIARAGEEYKKLLSLLPEFYVGQSEYLTAIIRVMCGAAKRSMKEKKIHLGPWRKSNFMQMKWSGHSNNTWTSTLPSFHHLMQATNEASIRVSRAHTLVVT